MSGTAAHLVDHVFLDVPVRPWVLSVPFEIRGLLAAVPAAVTRLDQIFTDEIFRWQRERARELGLPPRDVQSAGITYVQRFGGALNLDVHLHSVACDDVFTRSTKPVATAAPAESEERATFHRLRDPTSDEVSEIAQNVVHRFLAWCRRRGFVRDTSEPEEDDSNEPKPTIAFEARRTVALHLDPLGSTTASPRSASRPRGQPPPDGHDTPDNADSRFRLTRGPACGAYGRWDVHAPARRRTVDRGVDRHHQRRSELEPSREPRRRRHGRRHDPRQETGARRARLVTPRAMVHRLGDAAPSGVRRRRPGVPVRRQAEVHRDHR